jgi:hypothetical protein
VPELELPRVSTGGRRAEGDDVLARGAAIPRLEARLGGGLRDVAALAGHRHATGPPQHVSEPAATPSPETGPTVTATLEDGPLEGGSIEVEMVEARPPKTIDVPTDDGSSCRYCLAEWVQSGRSAAYTFLYRV